MIIYLDIVRFSFLRFFTYPFEIFSAVLKRIIEIVFLVVFWSIYIKDSGISVNITQILAYFLLAVGISDIAMSRWGSMSSVIGNQVKTGQISNYIIKPANLIFTLYSIAQGRNGMRIFLAIINISVAIFLIRPNSLFSLFIFFLFFINACLVSFAYDLFQGTLFLHFADAGGIRNSIQNFARILSGGVIPLYLFPAQLKNILRFSPFPSMIYLPANYLSNYSAQSGIGLDLAIGLFWGITLNILVVSFWHYSMKKYESVGI